MEKHSFHLTAGWDGGRLGQGNISIGSLQSAISIPAELNGPGVGTNPEEMLIGAASTCYLITLAAILENKALPVENLSLTTEGIVSQEGSRLSFEKIIHRPSILLAPEATEEQVETAKTASVRAEKACMISKAVQGNVEVTVEPSATVRNKA
ncbi:OsmC family protein [Aneurinibacillus tyrosinisolvens]|uniref:OsmC family protein n=1 Tax=Aneurinibacillus tyrosinisolvens TaxID=1443435 RepID=UPI00063F3A49|nr:OsmC family protein [Aneurinibacillus tyrosinisolvens]